MCVYIYIYTLTLESTKTVYNQHKFTISVESSAAGLPQAHLGEPGFKRSASGFRQEKLWIIINEYWGSSTILGFIHKLMMFENEY